jgi:hypothetical protein
MALRRHGNLRTPEALPFVVEAQEVAGGERRGPGTMEFCRMRRVSAFFGAVVALSTQACAAELPEGPNRGLVASRCTECHDLQMVFDAAGISRDDWNGAIEEMTSYGLKMTPEERTQILDYLATYLGPAAKK